MVRGSEGADAPGEEGGNPEGPARDPQVGRLPIRHSTEDVRQAAERLQGVSGGSGYKCRQHDEAMGRVEALEMKERENDGEMSKLMSEVAYAKEAMATI